MSKRIALLDQDGHTVRLTKEEIAACLKAMGNPEGLYHLLTERHYQRAYVDHSHCAIRIRARTRPNYSWFTLWRKKRMGSRLLDRKVPMMIAGKEQMVPQEAKPVWLRLKKNEVVTIKVK